MVAKGKKATKATKAATPAAAPAEKRDKSRPQRTPQNPFEHTEETLLAKRLNSAFAAGLVLRRTRDRGYAELRADILRKWPPGVAAVTVGSV